MHAPRISLTILTVALITAAVGCSCSDSVVKAGSLAKIATLKGATFTVGSKEFTEQLVLCQITSFVLRSVGATVQEKCGLQGSSLTRLALTSGSIEERQMAPEPASKPPTLRQAALALLAITATAAIAVGLGWVPLASLLGQVLAELFLLAWATAVFAYRYRPPR